MVRASRLSQIVSHIPPLPRTGVHMTLVDGDGGVLCVWSDNCIHRCGCVLIWSQLVESECLPHIPSLPTAAHTHTGGVT